MEISKVIFENSPIAILICDSNGNITNANNKFHSEFEYSKDELSSLNLFDIVEQKDISPIKNKFMGKSKTDTFYASFILKSNEKISRGIKIIKEQEKFIIYMQNIYYNLSEDDSNELLSLISYTLEYGKAGFWFRDNDNPVIHWDIGMRKIYEFDIDEIVTGEKWLDHVHPVDRKRIMDKLNLVMSKNEVFNEKFRIITKTNKIKYIHSIVNYRKNNEDYFDRIAGINIDISDDIHNIQKLNEANDKLITSINSANLGLWEYDYKLDRLEWNDSMFDIYDINKQRFKGTIQDWENSLHPEDLEYTRKTFYDSVKFDLIFDTRFRVVRSDNSIAYINAFGKMVKDSDGNPNKIYGINIDETEIEIEKKDILKNNKKLFKENKNAVEFISNLSSDLKSPLSQILSYSNLLFTERNQEEKREYYDFISEKCKVLISTLDKFEEFSKIKNSNLKIEKSRFRLSDSIEKISDKYIFKIEEKNINLDVQVDDNIELYNDKNILNKILELIIENSIKYTNSGHIKIFTEIKENNVLISIIDTGIGISEEDKKNVFEKYFQVNNEINKNILGSGLGLSIVSELAELINAKIWLKSVVNSGTKFFIELATRESLNESVLIVEDNDTSFTFLKILLKKLGLIPVRAFNGRDAIEKFESNNINLILMDMKLPVLDGYEATKIIKSINQNVPIIAVTSDSTDLLVKKAFDSGCDEHIAKPIKTKLLEQTILKALNKISLD